MASMKFLILVEIILNRDDMLYMVRLILIYIFMATGLLLNLLEAMTQYKTTSEITQ